MSVEHYTPAPIIEFAREIMGSIDLDPASCAEAQEVVNATRFYTREQNGIVWPWNGNVWCNPPYGAKETMRWVRHAAHVERRGLTRCILLLLNADVGRQWFRELEDYPLGIFRQRIKFRGPGGVIGKQPRFDNAMICLTDSVYIRRRFIREFNKRFGTVYQTIAAQ